MAQNPSEHNETFRALYDTHVDTVHRYITRRVASDGNHAVDDLVAHVFTVAYQRLDDITEAEHPVGWLLAVARRTVANHHRTTRRRRNILERFHTTDTQDDRTDRVVTDDAVRIALNTLTDKDQELLKLAFWEELTVPEMAVVLNTKPATISVRLHRARNRFATAYENTTTDPDRSARTHDRHPPDGPTTERGDERGDEHGDEHSKTSPRNATDKSWSVREETEREQPMQEEPQRRHEEDSRTHGEQAPITAPPMNEDTTPNTYQRTDTDRQHPDVLQHGDRVQPVGLHAALTAFKANDPAQGTAPHEPWRTRERIIAEAVGTRARPLRPTWFKPAGLISATGTLAALAFLTVLAPNTTPSAPSSQPATTEAHQTTQADQLGDTQRSETPPDAAGMSDADSSIETHTTHQAPGQLQPVAAAQVENTETNLETGDMPALQPDTLIGLTVEDAIAVTAQYDLQVVVNDVTAGSTTNNAGSHTPTTNGAPTETTSDKTTTTSQRITLTTDNGIVVDAHYD